MCKSSSIGFFGLLTIVFIVLKLIGYINWSWVWILSPIWIPMIVFVIFIFVVLLIQQMNWTGKNK